MIDYVHLFRRIEDHRTYLQRTDIEFVEGIKHINQEHIKYFWHNDLKTGCKIKVGYNNWLDFTGSITKYWYNENYTNLSYSNLVYAINQLADTLDSHLIELILRSFEFGLNIPMSLNFNALELTDFALNYKNNFFEDMDNNSKDPSIGKKCKLQEYQIKLYSKSMQYNLPFELLRYEIKVHKMNYLKNYRFNNLEDLINKDKLVFLKQELIKKLNEILFYDTLIPTSQLRPSQQELCLNWQSPIYRKNLKISDARKFHYQKAKLNNIIDQYGENKISTTLIQQVSDIWDNLLES